MVAKVDVVLLLTRLVSLALASAGLAIYKGTLTRYSPFVLAQDVLLCHVSGVAVEVAGQFVCFSRGTRPIPQDRLLCLCVLALDWFFAAATCCSGASILGITVQLHRIHRTGFVVWIEPNLVYGILGLFAGLCATATAICDMAIAARSGPLQFNHQQQ